MPPAPEQLTLRRPDDWHVHLRDGAILKTAVAHTAARFARALIMPNLKPPVTTTALALTYHRRILEALPPDADFRPLMALYLTNDTPPAEIERAAASDRVLGAKLYPAGATTHSDHGVQDIARLEGVLETMQTLDLPLQVHGEVTDPEVDVFDREAVFIERVLIPLHERYPRLRIVVEHASTRQAVEFVHAAGPTVAATITPQHLLYNRNALFEGGLRPHVYCLPVLKREAHRAALLAAATGDSGKFFLGTDSAPHPRHAKETGCGCAGIYSAHAALELYAEVFAAVDALDRLEGFASLYGARFYGLPLNEAWISLNQTAWQVPARYPLDDDELVALRAGQTVDWQLNRR